MVIGGATVGGAESEPRSNMADNQFTIDSIHVLIHKLDRSFKSYLNRLEEMQREVTEKPKDGVFRIHKRKTKPPPTEEDKNVCPEKTSEGEKPEAIAKSPMKETTEEEDPVGAS